MTPKYKRLEKIIISLLVGLFVLCVVPTFLIVVGLNTAQAEYYKTIAITATPVSEATLTEPVPMDTAVPTARPTATPTVKSTASPVPTINAANEYRQQLMLYLGLVQYDMQDFSDLNFKMAYDPYLIFDEDWIFKVDVSLDNMQHYFDLMANISPVPAQMSGVHAWIEKLSPEMREFAKEYRRGVNQADADLIEASLEHLTKMTEYINNVMAEPGW